ncbi:hypothetical protein D3C72_2254150 [compost metagenome]
MAMQDMRVLAHIPGDLDAVGKQQALVAGAVGHQLIVGRDVGVAFDQAADGG